MLDLELVVASIQGNILKRVGWVLVQLASRPVPEKHQPLLTFAIVIMLLTRSPKYRLFWA